MGRYGKVVHCKIGYPPAFPRAFDSECTGFERGIDGLVELEGQDGKKRYFADCVKALVDFAPNHA
jgi:arginine decarboxylase